MAKLQMANYISIHYNEHGCSTKKVEASLWDPTAKQPALIYYTTQATEYYLQFNTTREFSHRIF